MLNMLEDFVEELAIAGVPENVYNQYSYTHDENAARRNNLLTYLKKMYSLGPQIILVGEAPGYRGCRLTGVPFASEHLLMNNMKGLNLFGRESGYRLAQNKDKLLKEATATIIWDTLLKLNTTFLAWNAFPFHPHRAGNGESNRTPTNGELMIGQKPLLDIIELFKIKRVVAVGNKAEQSLKKLGFDCIKVRHPAQGGKNEFVYGMRQIYSKD